MLAGICLLAVTLGVVACSSDGAVNATSSESRGQSVEPGTGTEVTLELPETATSGRALQIPLVISAESEPYPWDNAALQIETEGPIIASADIDPTALEAGNSVQGILTILAPAGTAEDLTMGRVSITLRLRDGRVTTASRRVEFAVLADEHTTWLGHVTPDLLQLERQRALLDAGEMSPAEYTRARTEILETVTGTGEDPTD